MRLIYLSVALMFLSPCVLATELVHRPVNPNFGGSPLNGSFLMSQATAQDTKKEPPVVEPTVDSLQEFTTRLKESLLNEIANNASSKLFDGNGQLVPGRTVTIGGFSISISNSGGDALSVSITDGISNTQLTVPRATTTSNNTTNDTNGSTTNNPTFIPAP
jgi:curli production assembly/transport component CsgF